MSSPKEHADRLRADGIDPDSFLKVAEAAVEAAMPGRVAEGLGRLGELAREVHAAGFTLYFPFESCVTSMAEVFAGRGNEFLLAINHLAGIVTDLGEDATKSVQSGIPSICKTAGGRPLVALSALKLARGLAGAGIDPGETLLHAVQLLAEIAGDNPDEFQVGIEAIGSFARALHTLGVHATYPIQQGLCGALEAWRDEMGELPEALQDVVELVGSLQAAGISPYHVLEYGLSAALPAAGPRPWLRREVIPLGTGLAAQGIDPTMTLQAGVGEIAGLDEKRARATLAWAQAVADDGIDPGWFLEFALGRIAHEPGSEEAFQATLQHVDDLVRAISTHGHNPANTFRDGLPEALGGAETNRLLVAGTHLAGHRIDPGPALARGFATLRYACEERPAVSDAAMTFAERLIRQALNPWYPLDSGLPAILLVAGEDDGLAADLLRTLGDLLLDLHAEGLDPKDLCLYGISSLGRTARADPALFRTLLGLVRGLALDLEAAGLSPIDAVGTGMPAVYQAAAGDREFMECGIAMARELVKSNIDPAPFLIHAIPAVGTSLGSAEFHRLAAIAQASKARGFGPKAVAEALAALDALDSEAVILGLSLGQELLAEGIDTSLPLGHSIPAVLRACTNEARSPGLNALAAALREAWKLELPFEGLVDGAFVECAASCGGDPAGLAESLSATIDAASKVAHLPAGLGSTFLSSASHAASTVAGDRPEVHIEVLRSLVPWALQVPLAEGLGAALVRGLQPIARACGHDTGAFASLLTQWTALTYLPEPGALFEHAFYGAVAAAEEDPARLSASLGQLRTIGAACGSTEMYQSIGRLLPLISRMPTTWSALIVPACASGSSSTSSVLSFALSIERHLRTPEDLGVIREIVTQYGVRAPDLLAGLLRDGLQRRQILSLGAERETILSFLQDVPFADSAYYVEYRKIMGNEELLPAERRAEVAALGAELEALMRAVVHGEVTPTQERHPLFSQVLTYVFPPARSMSRETYLSLYRAFDDRPADVTGLLRRGSLPSSTVRLATGGYRIAHGARVDEAPWHPLLAAVREAPESVEPEDLRALGEALFGAWIEGTLAKPRTRDRLLARIYGVHRAASPDLPDTLEDAGGLLKYREFLSDTAREIVQDALAALRAAEPERYLSQARMKLNPRRRVGKGLVRGILRTAKAFRSGSVDRDGAVARLVRQLHTSDVSAASDQNTLLSLTGAEDPEFVISVIESLPTRLADVAVGEEHHRVLADLVGPELAAMERELFGDRGEPGKLEYSRDSGGPALEIRMELTKRKAHAPIGICEGVCTATDAQLWAKPTFLQCIFWDPSDRARGGMHLLRVERQVDGRNERALLLPGINPSLELLRKVGPETILDAAIAYARSLAEAIGLDEVWIPTHRAIATNRGPIRQALEDKSWPTKDVHPVPFSHSPHSYTVENVWVLPT